VRPTTDLAKESLFNILMNKVDFENISVLDLFAGIGNISLEFASRGASNVVSVEMNFRCYEFIRKSAHELQFDNLFVVKANVFNYLKSVKRQFDVIFADPPYDLKEVILIPGLVFDHQLLNPGGWLIIEHDSGHQFMDHPMFVEERRYGKVHFTFFRLNENAS
jgi:16S rRNA (guanine966-N2)-methyltransferase